MTRNKASPYSSHGGGESSMDGTPDTKLTAFSPEDSKEIKPYSTAKSATTPMSAINDPFVSMSTKPKVEQKLSATATSFQPYGLKFASEKSMTPIASRLTGPIPGTMQHLESIIAAEETSPRRRAQDPEITKFGHFTTETLVSRHVKVSSIFMTDVRDLVQESIDRHNNSDYRPNGTSRLAQVGNVVYLSMADDRDAVAIYNAITRDHDNLAVEFIQPNQFNEIESPLAKNICSAYEGQILVRAQYPAGCDKRKFEDDLRTVLDTENRPLRAWEMIVDAEFGTFLMLAEYHDASNAKLAVQQLHGKVVGEAPFGSVIFVKEYHPTGVNNTANSRATPAVTPTRQLGEQNDLCDTMRTMSLDKGKTPEAQIIPFATPLQTPAGLAYMPTTNTSFGVPVGIPVPSSAIYSPSNISTMLTDMTAQSPFPMGGFSPYAHGSYSGQANPQNAFVQPGLNQAVAHRPFIPASDPFESSSPGSSRQMSYLSRPINANRRQNASKVPYHISIGFRRNNPIGGHHNFVDVYNIYWGNDVRTTVMLRNIPNKVKQVDLKKILDESSFGKYDFMYLRIDFSNECNVGYAFINFTDPLDIIPFVQMRSGRKWDDFRSDKVAEVSYATIQGRDCLIQKFRNSSVMLEPESARPKLFYTFPHPMVGKEEVFPQSDNPSKLKRSCENAEHVGLFAPSAGQHLRDEQRRRRSQFDRGTTLAEHEEYGRLEYYPLAAAQRSFR